MKLLYLVTMESSTGDKLQKTVSSRIQLGLETILQSCKERKLDFQEIHKEILQRIRSAKIFYEGLDPYDNYHGIKLDHLTKCVHDCADYDQLLQAFDKCDINYAPLFYFFRSFIKQHQSDDSLLSTLFDEVSVDAYWVLLYNPIYHSKDTVNSNY